MKSNTAQLKIAQKYVGESCPKCCSMRNNCCCYYVCKIFDEAGNKSLFYDGKMVTYCPNAIKWCKAHLALIPIYLAMPMDVIYFDWNKNDDPDHIGFVFERIDATTIRTLEANTTSRYVVAYRTRTVDYILGVYRPHFKPTSYDTSKALVIDGQFGYNSIAMLQKALGCKVDAILGRDTVKALQKKANALVGSKLTVDGHWGTKTSKAVQKMVGVKQDGLFGPDSVKALQKWINANVKLDTKPSTTPKPTPTPTPKPTEDGKLEEDGVFGKKSITAAQKYFGTEADGVISGQLKKQASKLKGIDEDCITWGGKGSSLVKAIQKKLGAEDDGILGEDTNKAIQKWLGIKEDGYWGAETSKAFQKFLNDPSKNPPKKVVTLPDKIMDACKTQAEWMKNYSYGWEGHPTIAKSKKKGTCVTYVACVLQRLEYLKSGECVWHTEDGKVYGNTKKMTVIYPNKTIKAYKGSLKKGDIIMAGDKGSVDAGGNSHIFIITGKWDGNDPYMWDNYSATRIKNKKGGTHTYPGSKKIIAVVRLK